MTDSPRMQQHRDLAQVLRATWPLIRDVPPLCKESYHAGQIDQCRQDLRAAVMWYCLRVLGEMLPYESAELEDMP
ncbi:MAG: hypothetical protein INH34_18050 [Phycisphaerales bacterium]|nr:hypothetical protein [Phycisphaerales bacterium]